ncbi:transmembrane protein 42 isoform X3 [Sarcophilus harrisii]|uniref:Transmembrane protein 42 n=1 Tax=Sarcophilus harrisii TaxID=9305 RepID=A0A7N4V4N6_SARHA|nr:transmembrane protein 42 isoform X3 [Sarcophilus harrisii]
MAARGRGCRRRRSTGRDPGKGSSSASAPGSGSGSGSGPIALPLPLPVPVPAAMAAILGPSALARLRWGSAFCSVAAGGLGAFAAAFAKLALKPTSRGPEEEQEQEPAVHAWLTLMFRLMAFSLMIVSNSLMWAFFSKALSISSSSATASLTMTASNIIASAFLGYLLYGEYCAVMWWAGVVLILYGLALMHISSSADEELEEKKNQ